MQFGIASCLAQMKNGQKQRDFLTWLVVINPFIPKIPYSRRITVCYCCFVRFCSVFCLFFESVLAVCNFSWRPADIWTSEEGLSLFKEKVVEYFIFFIFTAILLKFGMEIDF